jgi:chemotaxis protein methyltransferase CheR
MTPPSSSSRFPPRCALSNDEFQLLARLIQEISGISLDEEKSYLVEERLGQLVTENRFTSFFHLYSEAKQLENLALRNQIIDAITTHETFFFRDGFPFEALQSMVIPELLKRRSGKNGAKKPLRIWSAGCSTGQELFSIAMILAELNPDVLNGETELLGTDISPFVLAKAQTGTFTKFEIERGLSPERRARFFLPAGTDWKIQDALLKKVSFRPLNLLQNGGFPENIDLVFCRNVAIYFQPADKRKIFSRIAGVMDPHGILCIGATENLHDYAQYFREEKVGRATFFRSVEVPRGTSAILGE